MLIKSLVLILLMTQFQGNKKSEWREWEEKNKKKWMSETERERERKKIWLKAWELSSLWANYPSYSFNELSLIFTTCDPKNENAKSSIDTRGRERERKVIKRKKKFNNKRKTETFPSIKIVIDDDFLLLQFAF